jgi:hypothetical protein
MTPPPAAAAPAQPQQQNRTIWPWLLGALVVAGALALLFRRRRRAREEEVYYEEPAAFVEREPMMAPPLAAEAPAAAAVMETGQPALKLGMNPVRAGVNGAEAVVEFQLSVENEGTAPARDVRISTWMFPAGSEQQSEMERMLIDRPTGARLAEVDPGDATRIETAVALPTEGLETDSVLPVVVAEARYRLSDGSEGRTAASFAVGVPWEGELAHFAIDHPSGLHKGVEAWPLGQSETAELTRD